MTKGIIVIAKNLPPWWDGIVLPRMADYAVRCEAKLDIIVPSEWRGMMTRQVTGEHVARYDRSLVLDADLVISREAPDIFDAHEPGKVWMANDAEPGDPDCMRQWPLIVALQAIRGSINWTKGYGNSGVILCDRDHSGAWTHWLDLPANTCPDQANLNYMFRIGKFPMGVLGREWNSFGLNTQRMPIEWEDGNGKHIDWPGYNELHRVEGICHGAHIFHAAGFAEPDRTAAIEKANELLP